MVYFFKKIWHSLEIQLKNIAFAIFFMSGMDKKYSTEVKNMAFAI
jgi:hypothetical protein